MNIHNFFFLILCAVLLLAYDPEILFIYFFLLTRSRLRAVFCVYTTGWSASHSHIVRPGTFISQVEVLILLTEEIFSFFGDKENTLKMRLENEVSAWDGGRRGWAAKPIWNEFQVRHRTRKRSLVRIVKNSFAYQPEKIFAMAWKLGNGSNSERVPKKRTQKKNTFGEFGGKVDKLVIFFHWTKLSRWLHALMLLLIHRLSNVARAPSIWAPSRSLSPARFFAVCCFSRARELSRVQRQNLRNT